MSRGKLILILTFVLALLLGVYFLFFAANPKDTVVEQLDAMKVDDVNRAYTFMSQNFQKTVPLNIFQETYKTIFANYRSVSFWADIDSDNSLLVSVEVSSGDFEEMKYNMIKEGLSWKINNIEFLTKASEAYDEDIEVSQ